MASISSLVAIKRISLNLVALFRGKSLLNETVKTMAFSVGIMGINMATGILTARMLGPEGRGIQAEMILWPQFLAFTTTFGIHSALLYHMKKSQEEEQELYYSSFLLTLVAGVVATLIGVFFIPLWGRAEAPEIVSTAQWFMLSTPFLLLFFMHQALFRGRDEFHIFNRMRYMVPLISLLLLVILAMLDMLTPVSSGVAYLLPYVGVTIVVVIHALRLYNPMLSRLRSAARKIISYGLGSYGIDLLGNLILYIDQIILISMLPSESIGLYVVAVSLSRIINIFSASIILVLFPKVSELDTKEAALLSLRVFKISTLFAFVCTAGIMLVAPLLIHILYGSSYLESIPVFRLLLLEVVIGGAAGVLAQSFMAVGRPFVVTISQAIGITLIIPLMYLLVPEYGLIGAGLSLLIPSLIRMLYVAIVFQWRFRYRITEFLINKNDIMWIKDLLRARKSKVSH